MPRLHSRGGCEAGSGVKCFVHFKASPLRCTQGLGQNPAQEAWTPVQERRKAQESLPAPSLSFLTCGMRARLPAFGNDRCPLPLQTVGESLLYMLEKCLGPAFTPAMRAAWSQLYGAVVQAMSRGWDGD